MAEVLWTNADILRLVKEYQKRRALWEPENDYYRTNSVKFRLWSEMAEIFKCEVADVRRKVNSILACYRKQKGVVKVRGCSSWYLYDYMSFLPNYLPSTKKQKKSKAKKVEVDSDAVSEKSENSDRSDKSEQLEQPDQPDQSDQSTNCSDQEENPQPKIIKTEPGVRKQRAQSLKRRVTKVIKKRPVTDPSCKLDTKLIEALKLMKKSELYRKKDECDIFGEYIATSLRRHDDWTRSMIKQGMNNILFEQDMKKYGGSSTQYRGENPLEVDQDDED